MKWGVVLEYLSAFFDYLKAEKNRHDFMDYARAILIILSIIAVLKAAIDIVTCL